MNKPMISYGQRRSNSKYSASKISISKILFSFILATSSVSAFTPLTLSNNRNARGYLRQHEGLLSKERYSTSTKSQFRMSSIDRDPEESNFYEKMQSWVRSNLPPQPEDQLTFCGDIGSIFFYTFIDHAVNGFYDEWLNSPDVIVTTSASAAIESLFAATADFANPFTQKTIIGNSFPVWFDSMSSPPFGTIPLSSTLPTHHIQYAPAIDSFGMASVLLASSWILCGYFTGAFNFENTLNCSSRKAIVMTTYNWVLTCALMIVIAYSSDLLVGNYDFHHRIVGLTRADGDFILGSLSDLIVWRFTLCSFLGYGSNSDDQDKKK